MVKGWLSLWLILDSMLTMPVSGMQLLQANLVQLVRIYLTELEFLVLITVRFCYSTIRLILEILLVIPIIGTERMLRERCHATMSMICVRIQCLKMALHFPMQRNLFSKILFLKRDGFRQMLMLYSLRRGWTALHSIQILGVMIRLHTLCVLEILMLGLPRCLGLLRSLHRATMEDNSWSRQMGEMSSLLAHQ